MNRAEKYDTLMDSREKSGAAEFSMKSKIFEYVKIFVWVVILVVFIRLFVVQAYQIPSGSMLPTLQIGDYLLVSKFSYGIRLPAINKAYFRELLKGRDGRWSPLPGKTIIPIGTPSRGDIIVFPYPVDPSKDFIKRVVAVQGDTIEIRKKKLFINNVAAPDPHAVFGDPDLSAGLNKPRDYFGPVVVPPGKLFVMGDNRDSSLDSRFWGFVDVSTVIGKAEIIYWSWDSAKWRVRWGRLGNFLF